MGAKDSSKRAIFNFIFQFVFPNNSHSLSINFLSMNCSPSSTLTVHSLNDLQSLITLNCVHSSINSQSHNTFYDLVPRLFCTCSFFIISSLENKLEHYFFLVRQGNMFFIPTLTSERRQEYENEQSPIVVLLLPFVNQEILHLFPC